MTTSAQRYGRALDGVRSVLDSFPAGRWEGPTPCPAWNARQLAGHLVDGQLQVAAMLDGGRSQPVTDPVDLARLAGFDPAASWRAVHDLVRARLDRVADDARVVTPLGDRPVAALLDTAVIEPLVHAWDLGVAAGREVDLDPEAVAVTVAALEGYGDALARSGMYAPALPVDDGADPQHRLLALTGRDAAVFAAGHH